MKKEETNNKLKKNDFILVFKESESLDKVKKQKVFHFFPFLIIYYHLD